MNGPGRWLLALDTSTEQASIALTDGESVASVSWHAGREQTVSLLAEIDHLLELAKVERSALAGIAVATGPGMFNGVRVAMSVAKGLHVGLGAALIGVSTLDAASHPFAGMGLPVIAVVPAGRGRLVWQEMNADQRPRNASTVELCEVLRARNDRVLIAGELSADQRSALAALPSVQLPPLGAAASRASAIAAIGWARLDAGQVDDPATLAPVYVHGRSAGAAG